MYIFKLKYRQFFFFYNQEEPISFKRKNKSKSGIFTSIFNISVYILKALKLYLFRCMQRYEILLYQFFTKYILRFHLRYKNKS